MRYFLFLDDERRVEDVTWVSLPKPPNEWIVVRSYEQFCDAILDRGIPEFVSFDHDLGGVPYVPSDGPEKTGYHCAQFLLQYCIDRDMSFPLYMVHSLNPVGGTNIRQLIEGAKRRFNFLEVC